MKPYKNYMRYPKDQTADKQFFAVAFYHEQKQLIEIKLYCTDVIKGIESQEIQSKGISTKNELLQEHFTQAKKTLNKFARIAKSKALAEAAL